MKAGVVVLRYGQPQVWDAEHGLLQTLLGAEPTVFHDADQAEFHIRKTVERWAWKDKTFRSIFTIEPASEVVR